MHQKKILIADDSELNRALLVDMLERDYGIIEVADGQEAIAALQAHQGAIEVLLLDEVMPGMDGFEVLAHMNRTRWIDEIPVIMISAETSSAYIDRAFKLGAADYVSRPFVPSVIRRRIMNTILLHAKKQQLLGLVTERYYSKERNSDLMVDILGHAVECRSGEGGSHMRHVGVATGILLRALLDKTDRYHLEQADVEAIQTAASLHDIGKLLIPEEILQKPSALTPEEFDIVKRHTLIGAKMIEDLPIYQNERLVKYAIEICRWHHERWEGEGYPDGLQGEEIPIAAQVVALADVYDALTSQRCYKEAYSHSQSMNMIRAGACGSFSPLLLECLEEVQDQLEKLLVLKNAPSGVDHSQAAARRVVEELYRNQDNTEARVAVQLEEEHAKRQFFSELTGELWFEYTAHPASIHLSPGAAKALGLSAIVVDPLDNADFRRAAGDEILEDIHLWVDGSTPDDTYFEKEARLILNGEPRWCQLAALAVWSVSEPGCISSLLGRVVDIDDRRRALEGMRPALAGGEASSPAFYPVMMGKDNVLRLTQEQVGGFLRGFQRMFDVARLVDPEICMELSLGKRRPGVGKSDHCYAVWSRMKRCERCVSQEVVRTQKAQTKIETRGSEVFYVLASYVEVDGRPYSLELVKRIQDEDLIGDGDSRENVLNQLLVRNRQVYMDSLTKVYNRRYFDEQLKNQEGPFAFAMIDMDNFKRINDRFGHLAGDAALYRAAQAIKSEIRADDELVRYGGDEFFLLFHDLPQAILEKKLQAILRAMERIQIPEYPDLHISASIGGAFVEGRISQTIRKADLAMYEAKAKKGCVAVYREENEDED